MLKGFKAKTIGYIISILVVSGLTTYTAIDQGPDGSLLLFVPVLIILFINFFRYVDRTNSEVATFLMNIQYNDFAVNFTETSAGGNSFKKLHGAFNIVNEKFRDIRSQQEAQFQYLQSIIENVDTGLFCFDANDRTILHNRALQGLLRKSYFPTLDSIRLYSEPLHDALLDIKPGENKLVKLLISGQMVQLSIRKTILKLSEDEYHLYALQNIHSELENKEVESWQKLIRILTHEIMNSVAPVVSLSATSVEILDEQKGLSPEDLDDVSRALAAINRRANGLLKFTETYRQLTKIPEPVFESVNLCELMDQVLDLLKVELNENQVSVTKTYPKNDVELLLDPSLIEQVLINILKNAMHALEGQPEAAINIVIQKSERDGTEISISDNGPGIPPEILENIFIPFYTTKKEGSGIGLSLSRQIIHKHKGRINATSIVGEGTLITIGL